MTEIKKPFLDVVDQTEINKKGPGWKSSPFEIHEP